MEYDVGDVFPYSFGVSKRDGIFWRNGDLDYCINFLQTFIDVLKFGVVYYCLGFFSSTTTSEFCNG